MKYFCPKCGIGISLQDVEFYKRHFSCRTCSSEKFEGAEINKQYIIHLCSSCLSYVFDRNPKNSQWKKSSASGFDDIVSKVLKKELERSLQNELRDEVTIHHPPITEFPAKVDVTISRGKYPSNEISVLLKSSLCKNCNKMLSRRFDAVIQLRTIKIKSIKAHDLLGPMIDEVTHHAAGVQNIHPEQFISDIDEQAHGFDLKLSNKAMMSSIQSFLTNKYPYIVKTSKKLMGKNPNTGGDMYRTYRLLRYIPFRVDGVIRIKNTQYKIKKIQANRIMLENLVNNSLQTRNYEFFDKQMIEIMEE